VERRSAQVRKLEYEVKLLREREQTKADAFISALHVRARSPPGTCPPDLPRPTVQSAAQLPPASANGDRPTSVNGLASVNRSDWGTGQEAGTQQSRDVRNEGVRTEPRGGPREGSLCGADVEGRGQVRSPVSSPERAQPQADGPSFLTPEKRAVPTTSPRPYVFTPSERQPGAAATAGSAFTTPEKRQVPAVASQSDPYKTPEKRPVRYWRSLVKPSPEQDLGLERGLSSQRLVNTGRLSAPRATSPGNIADRSAEQSVRNPIPLEGGQGTSPVYRDWAASKQGRSSRQHAPNLQTPSTHQMPVFGAQQAGFARWTPQPARGEVSPGGEYGQGGGSSRRHQETEARSKGSELKLPRGSSSGVGVGLDTGAVGVEERRGSASPGSDDSAKDLHAEIQKLQARIMDRLKDSTEKSDIVASPDNRYRL
jgi:hypothetical protein